MMPPLRRTAHKINCRAVRIGVDTDCEEKWGEPAMTTAAAPKRYRPTESKYKGGVREMYVTYDLEQKTRGAQSALYPKVRRVYIAGEAKDWATGLVHKKTGREVHGLRIEYEQNRSRYRRKGYAAHRGGTRYLVQSGPVAATAQRFAQVVEIPTDARNIHFYSNRAELPTKYRHALQHLR